MRRSEHGDIIVAKIRPCFENGKVAMLARLESEFGVGRPSFMSLRAKPGDDPGSSITGRAHPAFLRAGEASMTGSAGQRRVPASFFDRFEVVETDRRLQKLIADILDAIDDAIIETDALIAKLRTRDSGSSMTCSRAASTVQARRGSLPRLLQTAARASSCDMESRSPRTLRPSR